jgi:hypothetical protein
MFLVLQKYKKTYCLRPPEYNVLKVVGSSAGLKHSESLQAAFLDVLPMSRPLVNKPSIGPE